ncbi:9-O-acetylesterase [Candidatus Poribacteria bacterium]|nr:MAG: 9-O-acetylesterase [Candidatus Poribacteria bacterium]
MKRITLFLIGFLLLFTQPIVHAEVTLPRVIGSNMVLQRDMEVPIWGWASAGEEVTIILNTENVESEPLFSTTAVADAEGNWRTKLPAMAAGGPYILKVSSSNTLELTNILFGEVWVCSGQSNMQWSVSASKDSEAEIATANYPNIRLFYVPRVPSGLPQNDVEADWYETNPETIANFSAVAYYFGRKLYKNLDVPIGLINTSWGGTRIEPWTPPAGFASVSTLESISKEVQEAHANYLQQLPQKMKDIEAWIAETREALETGARLTQMPDNRHSLRHHARPTGLYNGMVHPLVPYAIRGALWYQGESNLRDGMHYHEKMKALINGWREVWGQGDFPFYFVQLAPFNYGGRDVTPFFLPQIWEAQTATLALPNTGMAVTTDIGNLRDIHPRNKQDVGRRLALWALAKTYGREDVTYSGPLYKSMTVEGNAIRLSFDHVGSGLMARDEKPLTWFEIAGEDKQFVEAQAMVDGDAIVVSTDTVANPVAVRFGWHQSAEPNLVNKEGLPASPFRTDTW